MLMRSLCLCPLLHSLPSSAAMSAPAPAAAASAAPAAATAGSKPAKAGKEKAAYDPVAAAAKRLAE